MLHYPHLQIPEERFAWIYPLSNELEPKAVIYPHEEHQRDIKATWSERLEGKELQTYGESTRLRDMCLPLIGEYPRIHCFLFFLVDTYLMDGELEYAGAVVDKRIDWMIKHPYKIINPTDMQFYNGKKTISQNQYGYIYYSCMVDWIGAMRSLQFYEIDIKKKIENGFVFRPRPRRKKQV